MLSDDPVRYQPSVPILSDYLFLVYTLGNYDFSRSSSGKNDLTWFSKSGSFAFFVGHTVLVGVALK